MRLLIQNLDAIATLLAGIWATHVAWCRPGITTPGLEALGRPERCIGPLLHSLRFWEHSTRSTWHPLFCGWKRRAER